MRLIDAEELDKYLVADWQNGEISNGDLIYMRELISGLEEVDATPVIRCKKCRYFINDVLKKDGTVDKRYKPSLCRWWRASMDENEYCSLATEREENEYETDRR